MKCLTWLIENQGVGKKGEVDNSNSSEETICLHRKTKLCDN